MAATTKVWVNNSPPQCEDADLNGFKNENNNLISSAGLTPLAGSNNQTTQAVSTYAAAGDFYTDSGVADAYVLNVVGSRQSPTSYVTGMRIRFEPGNTNTGASTVNVNGLGVQDFKLDTGADPGAGDIAAGILLEAYYDGTNFVIKQEVANATTTNRGIVELATQAEMEAATDTERAPTPSVVQYHPGVCKAWGNFDGVGAGAIRASYNVSGFTHVGLGAFNVQWSTNFSAADVYAPVVSCEDTGGIGVCANLVGATVPASNLDIETFNTSGSGVDPDIVTVAAFGDQ